MKFGILLALSLALALPLHARGPARRVKRLPTEKEQFDKLDTNHDGFLTLEEFSAGAKDPGHAEDTFHRKDVNGDGKLSFEEFADKIEKE